MWDRVTSNAPLEIGIFSASAQTKPALGCSLCASGEKRCVVVQPKYANRIVLREMRGDCAGAAAHFQNELTRT